jgi:hypothetical protein
MPRTPREGLRFGLQALAQDRLTCEEYFATVVAVALVRFSSRLSSAVSAKDGRHGKPIP